MGWHGTMLRPAKACAQVALSAPILATLVWLLSYGTRRWTDQRYWKRFPPDYGCDDSVLWDSCTTAQILWLLLPPAAAGALAIWLIWITAKSDAADHGTGTSEKAASQEEGGLAPRGPWPGRLGRLGRAAHVQLLPAQFWSWWCGGLSGADALLAGLWLVVNSVWLSAVLKRYYSLAPILSRLGHIPSWAIEVELTAVGLGALLFPNLVLLLYPVSRGSALLQALGVSYPAAIRYHRWLGHWVMVLVTAHSLGFWGVWLIRGEWVKEALDFGARVNNLMGGVSFLAGLALWVTSLDTARRRGYSLFYFVHHVGFWGFMVAGLMHYQSMVWYFLPGMLFYAADAAYRIVQAMGRRAVVLSASAPCGDQASVARLRLACPPYAIPHAGYVWLRVPEISRCFWHPFEFVLDRDADNSDRKEGPDAQGRAAGAPAPPPPGQQAMLIHAKAYDRWTRRFVQLVRAKGTSLDVRVEGPYPECPAWTQRAGDDAILIAAGGIGIAAALAVFEELPPSAPPVLLVWTARHPAELIVLAPRVLAAARALGGRLTAVLHYTGSLASLKEASDAAAAGSDAAPAPAAPGGPLPTSTSSSNANGVKAGKAVRGAPAAAAAQQQQQQQQQQPVREQCGLACHANHGSPLCPVVALNGCLTAQAAHKMAAHILACAGMLGGLLLVRACSVVWATEPWTTAAAGAAYVIAIAAGATLPGVLLIGLSAAAAAASGSRRAAAAAATDAELARPLLAEEAGGAAHDAIAGEETPAASIVFAGGGAAPSVVIYPGGRGAAGGAADAVPLHLGRPDLRQLVGSWLAGLKQLPAASPGGEGATRLEGGGGAPSSPLQVGCYAMGPSGLLQEVQLLCDDVNRWHTSGGAGGGGGGAQGAAGVFMRYVQKTHNL